MTNDQPKPKTTAAETPFCRLSPTALALLGVDHVAYVKAVNVDGQPAYAVHAADGEPMAVIPERETAFAAVRQHDMEPLSVH